MMANHQASLDSCRIDGRAIAVIELPAAIAERHGVTVELRNHADGLAFVVGTWQGLNCLRKSFVGDGYQVLTASDPGSSNHVLIIREPVGGPIRQRLSLEY